ncbi:hypothetical protein, partial [Amycolatopsis sp. SID8362]|uniref:hypothetical protein n=1 Tax=Amycolatopsis sp. SID8362 TaxID=2690346 RepID=UPI001EF1C675
RRVSVAGRRLRPGSVVIAVSVLPMIAVGRRGEWLRPVVVCRAVLWVVAMPVLHRTRRVSVAGRRLRPGSVVIAVSVLPMIAVGRRGERLWPVVVCRVVLWVVAMPVLRRTRQAIAAGRRLRPGSGATAITACCGPAKSSRKPASAPP